MPSHGTLCYKRWLEVGPDFVAWIVWSFRKPAIQQSKRSLVSRFWRCWGTWQWLTRSNASCICKNTATGTQCAAHSPSTKITSSRTQSIAHLWCQKPAICSGKMTLVSIHQMSCWGIICSIGGTKQLLRLIGKTTIVEGAISLGSRHALWQPLSYVLLKEERRKGCDKGTRLKIIFWCDAVWA